MASPVGVSTLVADDALKFVVPTFFGFGLFAPFWNPRISTEAVFLLSLFLGFAVTPIVGNSFLRIASRVRKEPAEIDRIHAREAKRWNLDRVFHGMSKDSRTAITLADARATMTLLISVYFGAYAVFVFGRALAVADLPDGSRSLDTVTTLAAVPVPLLTNLVAPSFVCILVGATVFLSLYYQYFSQQQEIFGAQYPTIAGQLQQESGGYAQAIWGRVAYKNNDAENSKAIVGFPIRLVDDAGSLVAKTCIEFGGDFTFEVAPGQYESQPLCIEIDRLKMKRSFVIGSRDVPECQISV